MKPIKVGGRRVMCPICKRNYATAYVFDTLTCGRCLRALFVGFMLGQNYIRKMTSREKEEKE